MMYVYLMAAADDWHKIGISIDPVQRRPSVGLYAPVEGYTELIMAVKVPPHKAYWIEQSALHATKGQSSPISSEWRQASRMRCYKAIHKALRAHGVRKVVKLKFRRSHIKAGWKPDRTNKDAIAASPKGWAMTRSYKTFGPSGRDN
jgi:hypothetical protein